MLQSKQSQRVTVVWIILVDGFWGRFSGVVEDDLKNTKTSVRDVQAILLNLFSADTILIGHSFEHSLYALKEL